jgi:hypothetical protein
MSMGILKFAPKSDTAALSAGRVQAGDEPSTKTQKGCPAGSA